MNLTSILFVLAGFASISIGIISIINGGDFWDSLELLLYGGAFIFAFGVGSIQELRAAKQVQQIGAYMKKTKMKPFLINKNVYCAYISDDNSFFIKEKTDGVKPGRCLISMELPGNAATVWALIQQKFTKYTTLKDIEELKIGERTIFLEDEKIPQLRSDTLYNEYCKMQHRTDIGEIHVSEIWPEQNEEQRSFIIKGDTKVLSEIFLWFKAYAMDDYDTLLAKYKQYDVTIATSDDKLIDVNNATLDELKKLPIVNVVTAKKLIKKREEIGGFNSVQDVCIFLRLTFTQEDRISKLICVKPMKISPAKIKTDERNVDL